MEIIMKYLEKTPTFENLTDTDKRIFNEILKKCIIHGKITDSNVVLSKLWSIPLRSLSRVLKNLKEANLVDTEFVRLFNKEQEKWYCSERAVFLNKIAFPFLSKDNIFSAEELVLKHIFEQEILIAQTNERIKQNELLKSIAKSYEKGDKESDEEQI